MPTTPDGSDTRRQHTGHGIRYTQRVTAADVGERVSVRHLAADPAQGTVVTDVVGRLLAFDDELVIVIDRHHQLYIVGRHAVLASRVVPPHPRLPAEPASPSRDEPLVRQAGRVLLFDTDDRVLLVAHRPGDGGRVWTAPGGGLRPGESHRQAAHRELVEETGVEVELGAQVIERQATFVFRGIWLEQHERWYLAHTVAFEASDAPLDDADVDRAEWWSAERLRDTDERLGPDSLAEVVDTVVRDGPPDEPWTVDG